MRRGLVKAVKVLGFTLALSVMLGAVAPSARAAWTPRRDMLGWMNTARSNHGSVALYRGHRLREMADELFRVRHRHELVVRARDDERRCNDL